MFLTFGGIVLTNLKNKHRTIILFYYSGYLLILEQLPAADAF